MSCISEVLIDVDEIGLRFIYSDEFEDLVAEGVKPFEVAVTRASHVEPAPGGWTAEMVNGGPTLGPFRLRAEALAAEVAWIKENVL